VPLLQPLGLKTLLEPGRFISGNAGILVTRIEYVKRTGKKNFLIVDAAMNDLIRPAFYDAYHEIVPLTKKGGATISSDVVGPICESGDYVFRAGLRLGIENGVAAAGVRLERVLRADAVAQLHFMPCRRGGRNWCNPCRWRETRRTRSAPCETWACAGESSPRTIPAGAPCNSASSCVKFKS
jgi:hypothetical protein